ncbi:FliC/FljB family flagellin [Morganella morganii]|uniref:FliC/FljB family flagellin n=1 Tax=Morganella morganii TaxID=582 RepID=UPI0007DB8A32|nr:FliC/FljB family flagellin [Morganella morganii]HDS7362178.1 FliC/FljB family flagellin [Morganella morganii subsp. morganii]OAR93782.1 flagellin [Morganella morganii]UEH02621.1 FliC/FljB family flagellin [Morganella morganii]WNJ22056.1 FliC/FljB family flagellin [Morganella morganii]HEO9695748.1 FliC/FljB family flagellin [Morganella morganii subsp. morganii]
MAQVINTNVLSLVTQNNLNRSQGVLGSAIERLSSGSRINSAKDDAAGQAIANRFTANVKGLTQASRNANDGISIAQTAEGAVNEINDNLQRIRELTVQAKNGTNSESDIASIQAEVKDRMDEITRISDQTQFNGIKVLASDNEMSFQVGANDGEVINLKMDKINLESLNIKEFKVPVPAKDVVLKGTGATATEILGADILTEAKKTSAAFTSTELDGHKLYETESGSMVAEKGGKYFEVKGFVADGTDAKIANLEVGAEIKGRVGTAEGLKGMPAPTDTDKSLKTLDDALTKVDTYRSKLGAFQNRMQSTINNLNNSVNNLSAARSRIQDADFATEVSNMSRGQILQQAGTAVLAQANQVPQGVLSLLR